MTNRRDPILMSSSGATRALQEDEAQHTEPMPTLLQLELDPHDLEDYLGELAHHAQIQELRIKSARTAHSADPGTPDLAALAGLLEKRSISAVQLVYTLEGAPYCDTLLCLPTGPYRLIRRPPASP